MTDRLTSHIRRDGSGLIRDDDTPGAWIAFEKDAVMEDPALATRRQTTVDDWTPGEPESHPGPQTESDDWR